MINRGKIREFQREQLVRVLDDPRFQLYRFGLNRKKEIVYISSHEYLTRVEMSLIHELSNIIADALERGHITINKIGVDNITQRRLERKDYTDELERLATSWVDSGDAVNAGGMRNAPATGGGGMANAPRGGHGDDH